MARSPARGEPAHPMQYDPNFDGPSKRRSCTDILCLFLFMTFIGCWVGIGLFAYENGDLETLLVPKDSAGSRCGLDEHVKKKPYLFFFDLTKCLNPTVPFTGCPTKQVCVENCPNETFIWTGNEDVSKLICDYNVKQTASNVEKKLCATWYLPSAPFKNRCIPNIDKDNVEKVKQYITENQLIKAVENLKLLTQAEQVGQNIVDDLMNSWQKIAIGIGIAALATIIYILILRWIAAFMVWLTIVGVIVLLSLSVYFTTIKYLEFRDNPVPDEDNANRIDAYLTKKDTWLVLLIISAVLLAIILLMLIFLRTRILLAIALVKEGSKAVSSVTSVLIFPIFPWVLQIGVVLFALYVGLNLTTIGQSIYKIKDMDSACQCSGDAAKYKNNVICEPELFKKFCSISPACAAARCKFIKMDSPGYYPYLQGFNVFGFLWLSFFVSDLGQMILASIFATWYWTWDKARLPFFAVSGAVLRTLRYHIGTLAFGSLIVAICRAIRLVLEFIDEKLKKYDNEITRAIMCCMKCFFWCLENFLKFINKNAYIMCAIHGKGFCASARDAFSLLTRNILRFFVLDKVTDFLFFLGKVLLTIGVGATAYVVFATDLTDIDNSGLNYNLVPVIAIMICTYLISSIFFSVYSMAVDTLFLCFLEDCERNDGSAEKPYFMSKNLMKIFRKKNKPE